MDGGGAVGVVGGGSADVIGDLWLQWGGGSAAGHGGSQEHETTACQRRGARGHCIATIQ